MNLTQTFDYSKCVLFNLGKANIIELVIFFKWKMSEITRFNKQPHFPKLAGFSPLGAECTGGGGGGVHGGGGGGVYSGTGDECR